jgi:hypothetical protein
MVAAEINDRLIPLLVRLNGWDPALAPTREPSKIQATDVAAVGALLQALAASGAPLWPNDDLLEHVLNDAGLPGPDPVTLEAAKIGLEIKTQQTEDAATQAHQETELGPEGRAALNKPAPPGTPGAPAAAPAKKAPAKKAPAKAVAKKPAPPAAPPPGSAADRMARAKKLQPGARAGTAR